MTMVKKLHDDAVIPERSNTGDAGLDLVTIDAATIQPRGGSAKLRTGLAFQIPHGFAGFIWPRSKLSVKYKQLVLAGVVDSGYRGEVMISVINQGNNVMEIRKGDRVAQMVIQPVSLLNVVEVDELDDTERGGKGVNDTDLRLR